MRKVIIFQLLLCLFACNQSGENEVQGETMQETDLVTTAEKEPVKSEEELILDIREKFQSINQNIDSYEVRSNEVMEESTEGGELKSYYERGALKKAVVTFFGEMGKSAKEYYFSEDNVFFILTQQYSYDKPMYVEGSKVISTEENRYYLNSGELVRWLDSSNEKAPQVNLTQKESDILQEVTALKKRLSDAETDEADASNNNDDDPSIKSLFELTPLSTFDETTEGLSPSEKNELLQKGASSLWEIVDDGKAKLTVRCKNPSSEVALHFFKNKRNSDGLLFAKVGNEENSNIHAWKYQSDSNTLQEASPLKSFSANDFVSDEDRLPGSYTPVFDYQFINEQTIEVSLRTWMEKEFENRDVIYRVFLTWNGESFEEKIEKI